MLEWKGQTPDSGYRVTNDSIQDDQHIRNSRELCGCTCQGICYPESCQCYANGIGCQVSFLYYNWRTFCVTSLTRAVIVLNFELYNLKVLLGWPLWPIIPVRVPAPAVLESKWSNVFQRRTCEKSLHSYDEPYKCKCSYSVNSSSWFIEPALRSYIILNLPGSPSVKRTPTRSTTVQPTLFIWRFYKANGRSA